MSKAPGERRHFVYVTLLVEMEGWVRESANSQDVGGRVREGAAGSGSPVEQFASVCTRLCRVEITWHMVEDCIQPLLYDAILNLEPPKVPLPPPSLDPSSECTHLWIAFHQAKDFVLEGGDI